MTGNCGSKGGQRSPRGRDGEPVPLEETVTRDDGGPPPLPPDRRPRPRHSPDPAPVGPLPPVRAARREGPEGPVVHGRGGGLPGIQPSRDFVTPSRTPTPQSPPPSTLDPAGTTRPPRPATPARTVETSTSPPALDPRRRPVRTRAVCPPPDVPLGTATGVRGTHPRRHSDPTTRDERPETRSQRGRPFPLSLPRGSPDDTPTLLPPHGTRGTVGCGRGSSDLYT